MKEIAILPPAEFWRRIASTNNILPATLFQRASTSLTVKENGLLTNVPTDSPALDWQDGRFMGIRIDRAATNVIQHSNPTWAFEYRYGILQGTERLTTPNGTSVLSLRETPNEQTYNDHVADSNSPFTDTVSSVRTFSFTIKCTVNNKDRGFGLRIATSAGNFTCYAFFKDDLTLDYLDALGLECHYRDLGNGWYRVWAKIKTACTVLGARLCITSIQYGGQWTAIDYGLRFFIADIMVERQLVSSMPVLNAGSQNTRAADNAYLAVGTSSEHCLFIESETTTNATIGCSGCLYSTITAANHISMTLFGGTGEGLVGGTVLTNTSGTLGTAQVTAKNSVFKQAISYNEVTGALKMYHNGVKTVDAIIAKDLKLNHIGIGRSINGQQVLGGYIRAIGYWKEALDDKQLEQLTSF